MARLRLAGISWSLLAASLALLATGCSKSEECVFFSVRFHGIGHLGTVSPDSSIALGVSPSGTAVVGAAADRHGAFQPGMIPVLWAETNQHLALCPGKLGVGLERLPLCAENNLAEPIRGAAFGFGLGQEIEGGVTCGGVMVPVEWTCPGPTLLPTDFTPGSGVARQISQSKPFSAAVGFATPSLTASPEDTAGYGVVWAYDSASPKPRVLELPPPSGSTNTDGFAIWASPSALGGWAAGIGYDADLGRDSSSVPAGWAFQKTSGLPWRGAWAPYSLTDDTGAKARGAATSLTDPPIVIFGHVVKNGAAQACSWTLTPNPTSVAAALLASPPGVTDARILSCGHDGTIAVGYGNSPTGPKAIAYYAGTPVVLQDNVNTLWPGTIPADWTLQEARAVSHDGDANANPMATTPFSWAIVGRGLHGGVPEGWVLRFERVKLPWWQCLISQVPIIKDPHLFKWPPHFPPGDPAFRAMLDRARAEAGATVRPSGTTDRTRR